MAFAGDLTLVQVRDQWLKADGTPESGSITFTPSAKFRNLTSGQQIAPTSVKVALDNTGAISVYLPAVDDSDYDPLNFTYRVDVQLDSWSSSYNLAVPSSSASGGIDLGLVVAVASSPGVFTPGPDPLASLIFGRLAWLLA